MGQQQLLLIVLGVIIVGIAVVVGINVFTASSAQANSDAVISDCTNLASMAQQYYRKPEALGGGGNSFTDWKLPANLASNANGSYKLTTPGDQQIIITGTGSQLNNKDDSIKVTMTVGPDKIVATTTNVND